MSFLTVESQTSHFASLRGLIFLCKVGVMYDLPHGNKPDSSSSSSTYMCLAPSPHVTSTEAFADHAIWFNTPVSLLHFQSKHCFVCNFPSPLLKNNAVSLVLITIVKLNICWIKKDNMHIFSITLCTQYWLYTYTHIYVEYSKYETYTYTQADIP